MWNMKPDLIRARGCCNIMHIFPIVSYGILNVGNNFRHRKLLLKKQKDLEHGR
jgi:hypothetical protein